MTSRRRTTKEKAPKLSAAAYKPIVLDPVINPPTRRGPRPLVYLAEGRYLTQNPRLPRLHGQVGLNGDHPAEWEDEDLVTAVPAAQHTDANLESVPLEHFSHETPISPSKTAHKRKKDRQWKRWLKEVIPSLIEPWRIVALATPVDVAVIRFAGIEQISVWFCSSCCPTAPQLLRSGLLPCAPFAPSLSVDIRMLDFLARLFLRISPNVTAWCGALEDYLRQQGYWLQGQDPLRRRFGNCLLWFNSLQDAVRACVKSELESVRAERLQQSSDVPIVDDVSVALIPAPAVEESVSESEEVPSVSNGQQKRKHTNERPVYGPPLPPSWPPRASAYLRSRCAICFGGTSNPKSSDQEKAGPRIIVTLDACFTHKHNRQSNRDPPRLHPDTMYIPEDEVQKWEAIVNEARPSKPTKRAKPSQQDSTLEDDHYEHGMRVPKSVLDGCLGSFNAAQETISSSSSSDKFDKTADAGMFCQHDVALFMVAINSAGERQHYMLALIAELFKHIPGDWTVGILYDIGCQTERSCHKWGFLKEYLRRIIWAVSVFHAYGHNWACQLIYHPRKRRCFGLCDGEGFGYYLHFYTIDTQLHFHNEQTLWNAGKWLQRKTRQCASRRLNAQRELEDSQQDLAFLTVQWEKQVQAQTQPLPRQRRNAAKVAVQDALHLNEALDILEKKISDLENVILSKTAERYQTVTVYEELMKARKARDKARIKLSQKERSLGTSDKIELRKLINDPYITKRLNALAVKTRLRQKLEARNEVKLHDHTRDSVQRRDPSILALATKYNNLCDGILDLIKHGKAPAHAVHPIKIDKATLFALDTDEDVWQDVGLTENGDQLPPPWMVDENVRKGIRAMLELDRCAEESARLRIQRQSLQEWFLEEWEVLMITMEREIGNTGLMHQLGIRRDYLLRLCVTWEQNLVELSDGCSSFWGPSSDELRTVRRELLLDAVGLEQEDDFGGAYLEDVEVGLTEQLDTRDIADSYREMESNNI
ncbi:hypothetical protein VKT23_016689 [Stygiomarasmius scandens]|uniref:CxC1-like cysteine cluster associated with KDZ transposases domain-containing protein n=1 Tax=Marasmiellus scandens TaxID=2682957 RepID=A0ABR1IWI1_9AGAR